MAAKEVSRCKPHPEEKHETHGPITEIIADSEVTLVLGLILLLDR